LRIARLAAPGRFVIEDVPVPKPALGEVLVRVVGSGVCASDLETWRAGPLDAEPRFLGHEVSGVVVEATDDVTRQTVGERVAVWVTERGFAEYVTAPAGHCFPAGDGPLDEALAEPLACAVNAVALADVRLGDDVVVVGAGFMGQLVQRLVALRGVRHLVVSDPRPDALLAAEQGDAIRLVDPAQESLSEVVRGLTDGRGADVTFECTGTQAGLLTCGEITRMSGKIAIVGFHQGPVREVPLGYWNWMAFTILNGHFRETSTIMRGMDVAMRLVSSRRLSVGDLVTHRFSLNDIDEAFATLRDKPAGFVKAVITFPEG
jgi:threonine dehydrogenase-like Zn-dependent dehydrogenase